MALRSSPKLKTVEANGELAASIDIDPGLKSDQRYLRTTVATSRHSSRQLWDWFDKIGEVHYAISRAARIAGYAKPKCVLLDDAGKIQEEVTEGIPAEIVRSITSPYGGTRALVDRFYTLMKVPADSYLVRLRDDDGDPEGYHFLSPDELDVASFASWRSNNARLRWITVPHNADGGSNDRFTRPIRRKDMLGRVWTPSRRYVDLADSALGALSTECETLHMLTESIKGKLMSRFALAGILYIPNGISTARTRRNQATLAGQPVDDTLSYLVSAMTRNVKTWDDATVGLPILLKGNPDLADKIRHITTDREIFEADINLRAELISRILNGLDSNQDMTKGTSDQNHFGVWASADEERRVAVQPDLEIMSWALTRLVLHAELQRIGGMAPEQILRYAVWYDLSDASVRANQQEDARQLRDRGLISGDATLRMSGVQKEDRIGEEEYVRWVGRQVKNPILMLHGMDVADEIDWEAAGEWPASTGPSSDSPADDPEAGPGEGDPGSPDDRETDVPRTQRPA